jgi:hypothetical protein
VTAIGETALEKASAAAQNNVKGRARVQKKYHAWQTIARIHLLRGESFQAAEAIDKAFASGELKNLQTYEMSGLLMG